MADITTVTPDARTALLTLRDVRVQFDVPGGRLPAVNG